jgi:hypothetical protein
MVRTTRPIFEPALSGIPIVLVSAIPFAKIVCDSAERFPQHMRRVLSSGPQSRKRADRPLSETIPFRAEIAALWIPRIFVESMPAGLQDPSSWTYISFYIFLLFLDALRTGGYLYRAIQSFAWRIPDFLAYCRRIPPLAQGRLAMPNGGRNNGAFF